MIDPVYILNIFLKMYKRVCDYGSTNLAAIYVDEDDIAMYTIKTIDDPRTLNKTVYIRPPLNILSQREVVQIWEKHIGKELKKSSISEQEFLACFQGKISIFKKVLLVIGIWLFGEIHFLSKTHQCLLRTIFSPKLLLFLMLISQVLD